MGVLGKFAKQAFDKGLEKAKQFFHKKEHGTTHPPKEQEVLQKPSVKEPNQKSLSDAAAEGKVLQKNGVTTQEHHTSPPSNAAGGNTSSEPHRAIQQDKPVYDPKIPKQRDQAKANDKGLSH
jgi:hypothetical protein